MKIQLLIATGILGTALAAQAVPVYPVVFQSDFTGTTLADADLLQAGSGNWVIDDPNDRLRWTAGSNNRGPAYTTTSWQNDGGFTLDVTFRHSGNHVRFSMGLVDDTYDLAGAAANAYWLGTGLSGAYGIGFVAAGSLQGAAPAGDCLGFNDGTGSGGDYAGSTKLSIDQGDATQGQEYTFSMTVTPDSWSYSLNGAPASTGSFTFDTSRSYRFVAYAQNAQNSYISNVTLADVAPIPTLSEWGMILLVGLVVLVMGRRMLRKPLDSAPTEA